MSQTVIRGAQILNNTVQRQDLDTSTVGQAVVTKIVQGSGITLSSTGADSGTGDVTVNSPDTVSTDAGNIATLGTDNHILVPQSQIWSVRLRSVNAVGNPTFEVDQRNVGTALTNPANGAFLQDRWQVNKTALTGTVNTALQSVPTAPIVIPGTNFGITQNYQRFTVGTAQASLAAGDYWFLGQSIEGPRWRELSMDVHSLSLLVRSSVANLAFSVSLRDSGVTHSLVKQCTLGAANTWALITLPNLPVWSGTFSAGPGQVGYVLAVVLAAGTTLSAAASSAWQAANVLGVTGMNNFLATAGATFDIGFVQHQPGAFCETPIDCQFEANLRDCKRYFQKSYPLGTALRTIDNAVYVAGQVPRTLVTNVPGVDFEQELAIAPTTLNIYSPASGNPNSVQNITSSAPYTLTAVAVNAKRIGYLTIQSGATAGDWIGYNYGVDTGW